MLLQPVFFTLGVISAVCAAPFAPSSNLATPSLAVRAKTKQKPKVVDISFGHWFLYDQPPDDVQQRIAMAVFGDVGKVSGLNWINGYTETDEHFEWRLISEEHSPFTSGWSNWVEIPPTKEPGKNAVLVNYDHEEAQVLKLLAKNAAAAAKSKASSRN
ncbi:hypothetical protein GGU10DRAFT_346583 [Lentinula aff. detonsa]|uniref:Calycin-like protein n=1 Tax=Lentinula aff. detonsa TaxID=2804958 RepID=A0AA38KXY0_9AGAR|nr:hypothetical protein GGU10DRAFT_346583 [Lentinula aff. detonsa]